MPFVIRHGSKAQADMAREQGRLQAEAMQAQADADLYTNIAGSVIGVANRYFARRDRERQQKWEAEQAELDRQSRAEEAQKDRTSRETIAGRNIEGRLDAVEKQQEGMLERTRMREQGQTERTTIAETGRNERFTAGNEFKGRMTEFLEEGRNKRATETETGRNKRAADELRAKAEQAAREAAVDAQMADKATKAVALHYDAAGKEMDEWGQLAIEYVTKGRAIPKWIQSRLPGANAADMLTEKPSDTEQAWRDMARINPMGAWAAANEKQVDKDGNPTNIPTRQAASALRGIIALANDPMVPPNEIARVYTELKLRMLDDPQPSPALEEIVRMLEARLGTTAPAVQASPKQQGGGFWGGYAGAMDTAMTWTNPLYAGGKAIYKAATGKGQKPADAGEQPKGSNLDAVLDSMSPEEIRKLLEE